MTFMRHGCFSVQDDPTGNTWGIATLISGADYTVNPAYDNTTGNPAYFIVFGTPPGGLDSTVVLDVRNGTTGRPLSATVQRGHAIDLMVALKEPSVPGQGVSVCFTLMR